MPITFECSCGRKFRTSDENAGRSATCPECRTRLVIPATAVAAPPAPTPPPLPVDEPADAYPVPSEEVASVRRRPADAPPYGRPRDDAPGRRRPYYGRDDITDRIVKRPPIRQGGPTNAGALAGLAMMVGAVVWFVVGLFLNIIFFYPPFLFIIGMIAFIKGLASGGRR